MAKQKKTTVSVHEGRSVGVVVSVRMGPDEAKLLRELAKRDGNSLSETLRTSLRAYAQIPDLELEQGVGSYTRSTAVEPDREPAGTY